MDQNWPRWIVASIYKHFNDRRQGLPTFVEGSTHIENTPDYIEIRVDGPYILEQSRNYFQLDCEINILITAMRDEKDLYKLQRSEGIVIKAFKPPINIFKLGDGDDDDQSLLGCMTLVRSGDSREALRISRFGQMDVTKPILRSSVEGHYHLYLHG